MAWLDTKSRKVKFSVMSGKRHDDWQNSKFCSLWGGCTNGFGVRLVVEIEYYCLNIFEESDLLKKFRSM